MCTSFHELKDRCRENLLPNTRRAFAMLPSIKNPVIADIGCGTGVPTIELARLSDGMIYAVDTDECSLEILRAKAERCGYRERIRILRGSIDSPELPPGGVDILWAEGLFNVIGFEKGISAAKGLVKPGGFLVIHDEIAAEDEKHALMVRHGFSLLDSFVLDETIWWNGYYSCLERTIASRAEGTDDEAVRSALVEIQEYKKHPESCRSIFYILKKTG